MTEFEVLKKVYEEIKEQRDMISDMNKKCEYVKPKNGTRLVKYETFSEVLEMIEKMF